MAFCSPVAHLHCLLCVAYVQVESCESSDLSGLGFDPRDVELFGGGQHHHLADMAAVGLAGKKMMKLRTTVQASDMAGEMISELVAGAEEEGEALREAASKALEVDGSLRAAAVVTEGELALSRAELGEAVAALAAERARSSEDRRDRLAAEGEIARLGAELAAAGDKRREVVAHEQDAADLQRAAIAKEEDELSSLRARLALESSLRAAALANEREIASLRAELSAMEQELEQAVAALAAERVRSSEEHERVSSSAAAVSVLMAQLDADRKGRLAAEGDVARLGAELAAAGAQQQVVTQHDVVTSVEGELAALHAELLATEQQLEEAVTALVAERARASDDHSSSEVVISNLRAQVGADRRTHLAAEGEIARLNAELLAVGNIQRESSTQEHAMVSGLEGELASLKAELTAMEQQYQVELAARMEDCATSSSDHSRLSAALMTAEQNESLLREQLVVREADVSRLGEQLRAELVSMERQNKGALAALAAERARCAELMSAAAEGGESTMSSAAADREMYATKLHEMAVAIKAYRTGTRQFSLSPERLRILTGGQLHVGGSWEVDREAMSSQLKAGSERIEQLERQHVRAQDELERMSQANAELAESMQTQQAKFESLEQTLVSITAERHTLRGRSRDQESMLSRAAEQLSRATAEAQRWEAEGIRWQRALSDAEGERMELKGLLRRHNETSGRSAGTPDRAPAAAGGGQQWLSPARSEAGGAATLQTDVHGHRPWSPLRQDSVTWARRLAELEVQAHDVIGEQVHQQDEPQRQWVDVLPATSAGHAWPDRLTQSDWSVYHQPQLGRPRGVDCKSALLHRLNE